MRRNGSRTRRKQVKYPIRSPDSCARSAIFPTDHSEAPPVRAATLVPAPSAAGTRAVSPVRDVGGRFRRRFGAPIRSPLPHSDGEPASAGIPALRVIAGAASSRGRTSPERRRSRSRGVPPRSSHVLRSARKGRAMPSSRKTLYGKLPIARARMGSARPASDEAGKGPAPPKIDRGEDGRSPRTSRGCAIRLRKAPHLASGKKPAAVNPDPEPAPRVLPDGK